MNSCCQKVAIFNEYINTFQETTTNNQKYIVDNISSKYFTYDILRQYIDDINKYMKLTNIDIDKICETVWLYLKNRCTIDEFEKCVVTTSADFIPKHYNYQYIGVYILVSKMHRETYNDYSEVVRK